MHFAFNIQEILDIVLNVLYEDAVGYKSLVALALTCKAFQKPSLDLLWQTLPNWSPLIRCLPADAWEVNRLSGEYVLRLRRDTTDDDWSRCHLYARRIRRLGYAVHSQLHSERYRLDPIAFKALADHGIIPFVNLHAYRCGAGEFLSLRYPLGQGLTELEIVHYPHKRKSRSKADIFSALTSFYPSLRTLKLSGEVPLSTSPISEAITGFHELQAVFCPRVRLADDVLAELAARNRITSFHTANSIEDLLRTFPEDSVTFPDLHHLGTESHTLSNLSKFLLRIGSASLRSINFGFVLEDGLPEDPQIFFQAIQDHCSPCLKSILFQNTFGPSLASLPTLVDIQSFKPLLAFPNIEELQICSDWALEFSMDDKAIETMAKAWPNMRSLDFDGGDVPWRQHVTLDGLLHIVRLWPDLESLNVALYPTTTHTKMPALSRYPTPQLKSLGVGNAVRILQHPIALTVFLRRVFPHLSSVYDFDWREDWMKISDFLRQYSKGQVQFDGDPIRFLHVDGFTGV